MKKRFLAVLMVFAVLAALMMTGASAETREGVIWLEGMEETITETLYECPDDFAFWYVEDFEVAQREDDDAVVVSHTLSDAQMILRMIDAEEAAKLWDEYMKQNITEQPADERVQAELYTNMEERQFVFATFIGERGKYLLAEGRYALEAADGVSKYFDRILDSLVLIHPEDHLGFYSNSNYDSVMIDKTEDGFVMAVSLYRLASLDEGSVTFSYKGAVFTTTDPSGEEMVLSFSKVDGEAYRLQVEKSTWDLLETGTVFEDMTKEEPLPMQ